MKSYKLAFVGFGNVGQALARLFLRKKAELAQRYHIAVTTVGIATGRHGTAVDPDGIDLERALALMDGGAALDDLSRQPVEGDILAFIRSSGAEVLFENSPVNYKTGQPAIDHLRVALERGMHAITANKGPVVHAYQELSRLAAANGVGFRFESTVMDGAPIFSLFREALPGARLLSLRGILNSTTNLILGRMERGDTFKQAVAYAQQIGIAETDPSGDIDGWDAAIKVSALASVLMGLPLTPDQVSRVGIRHIGPKDVTRAAEEGKRWKLVCSARRVGESVEARVAPEQVPSTSPLYSVEGTSSIVEFETDVLGPLSIVEANPGPDTTAYGLFADFLNLVQG
jgi:homoserine dehydrogenase